jgi:hypothetical protein
MNLKGYNVDQSPPWSTHVKNPLGCSSTALCCSHHQHRSTLHSRDGQVQLVHILFHKHSSKFP